MDDVDEVSDAVIDAVTEDNTVSTADERRTPLPMRTALGVGAIGGCVGALLGGGTGTVVVPALGRLTTLPRRVIHGTSGIANIAVAVVGVIVYALRGNAVNYEVGVPLMIGGVFGAVLGAKLVVKAPEKVLRTIFVVVLVIAGIKLLLDALTLDPLGSNALLPADVRGDRPEVVAIAIALGVVIGAWSAALGLGGGLLTVPALALLFGTGLHTAESTSLAVMLPNSIVGTVAHVRQRTASVPVGVRLACGSAVGAVLGALLAVEISSTALGLFFGLFMLVMAAQSVRAARSGRTVRSGPTGRRIEPRQGV
jgi:hypothetical protein